MRGRSSRPQLGVRKLLCNQISAAIESLGENPISGTNIHAARKSLKKARATLRLLRPALPAAIYRRENTSLRDTARPLSAVRDAHVLLDTLDRLEKLYGEPAKDSIPAAFRRALQGDQRKVRLPGRLTAQVRSLATARNRIMRARLPEEDWQEIGQGLQKVYAGGRKAMRQALRAPTPECFHEWRKQAKYLWHQLQVLEPLWPGPIGELADQLHKLSDYLGDDHDLAVLREQVLARPKCFPAPGGTGPLLALIDRCQHRLRAKAERAGARIYSEKPSEFTARFGRYWKQWQSSPMPG